MAEETKSRYEPLTVPEFKSSVPAHLLGKLSDQERYLIETLSKMEQQNAWVILNIVRGNAAMIDLDVRQQRVESWKERIMSKWTLVAGAFILFATELIRFIMGLFTVKKGP